MKKISLSFKKALTPVSIMVIPHENLRPLNIQIPTIVIFFTLLLSIIGGFHVFSLIKGGLRYPALLAKVDFYSKQFSQWNLTMSSLQEVEKDFRRIFSLKSKDKILEAMDTSYSGSVDIENLMTELQKKIETIDEIKDYLRIQKDIYSATPRGYPVDGHVTSRYGKREDPFTNTPSFHSGIDLSASPGTPIRASADGVVSYSGWTQHSGYVVVLEHAFGYSTVYAHNKKNAVKVARKVKRGDILGYVGSTGKSTGPHVHYEIWERGKTVDPKQFQGES